eukprot:TRINITY_DN3860_c0_g2_i1.p1 TRINITY_DN3860_c0_g2~~TRINITY_DN3860_c0_g2_i1.p1  ORF type:complete len:3587 (-),score=1130.56 TRINITY_DN3860_c0_g2_i1:52-10812(-)
MWFGLKSRRFEPGHASFRLKYAGINATECCSDTKCDDPASFFIITEAPVLPEKVEAADLTAADAAAQVTWHAPEATIEEALSVVSAVGDESESPIQRSLLSLSPALSNATVKPRQAVTEPCSGIQTQHFHVCAADKCWPSGHTPESLSKRPQPHDPTKLLVHHVTPKPRVHPSQRGMPLADYLSLVKANNAGSDSPLTAPTSITTTFIVIAEDNHTASYYTVVAKNSQSLSADATLCGLSVALVGEASQLDETSGVEALPALVPAFHHTVKEYTMIVPNAVDQVSLQASTNDPGAHLTVSRDCASDGPETTNELPCGAETASEVSSSELSNKQQLALGENKFSIHSTAQNGFALVYEVTVLRSQTPVLESLVTSIHFDGCNSDGSMGQLTPLFQPKTWNYTANVINRVTSIDFSMLTQSMNQPLHVTINGDTLPFIPADHTQPGLGLTASAKCQPPINTDFSPLEVCLLANGWATEQHAAIATKSEKMQRLEIARRAGKQLNVSFNEHVNEFREVQAGGEPDSEGSITVGVFSCFEGGLDSKCHTVHRGLGATSLSYISASGEISGDWNFDDAQYSPYGATEAERYCMSFPSNHDKAPAEVFRAGGCEPEAASELRWTFAGAHNHFTCASPGGGCLTNRELLQHCPGKKLKFDQGCKYETQTKPLASGLNEFVIEATNALGKSSTYTVMVNRDPQAALCGLNISIPLAEQFCVPVLEPFAPAFSFDVLEYTMKVPNGVDVVQMQASVNEDIKLEVQGKIVKSGAIVDVKLVPGDNVVPVDTISVDGETRRHYTVTVHRVPAPSGDASLCGLDASYRTCVGPQGCDEAVRVLELGWLPGFNPDVLEYKRKVGFEVASAVYVPKVNTYGAKITVSHAQSADENGPAMNQVSGGATPMVHLLEGFVNVTRIEVTAQDGTTKKTYLLTVTRGKSPDDTLKALSISEGPIPEPAFSPSITHYSTVLPNPCFTCDGGSVPTFTLTPTANHFGAKVTVGKDVVASGHSSPPMALLEGASIEILIKTLAQNGLKKTVTTLTVSRDPSPDSALSSIVPSYGTLYPAFAADISHYHVNADSHDVDSMLLTSTTRNRHATIRVNQQPTVSGMPSRRAALEPAATTTLLIEVSAQDGTHVSIYTVAVTRAACQKCLARTRTQHEGAEQKLQKLRDSFRQCRIDFKSVMLASNAAKRDLMITRVNTNHMIKVKQRLAEHKKEQAADRAKAAKTHLDSKVEFTVKMQARMAAEREQFYSLQDQLGLAKELQFQAKQALPQAKLAEKEHESNIDDLNTQVRSLQAALKTIASNQQALSTEEAHVKQVLSSKDQLQQMLSSASDAHEKYTTAKETAQALQSTQEKAEAAATAAGEQVSKAREQLDAAAAKGDTDLSIHEKALKQAEESQQAKITQQQSLEGKLKLASAALVAARTAYTNVATPIQQALESIRAGGERMLGEGSAESSEVNFDLLSTAVASMLESKMARKQQIVIDEEKLEKDAVAKADMLNTTQREVVDAKRKAELGREQTQHVLESLEATNHNVTRLNEAVKATKNKMRLALQASKKSGSEEMAAGRALNNYVQMQIVRASRDATVKKRLEMVQARNTLVDARADEERVAALTGRLESSAAKAKDSLEKAKAAGQTKRSALDIAEMKLKEAQEFQSTDNAFVAQGENKAMVDALYLTSKQPSELGESSKATGPTAAAATAHEQVKEAAEAVVDARAEWKIAATLESNVMQNFQDTSAMLTQASNRLAAAKEAVVQDEEVYQAAKGRMKRFEEQTVGRVDATAQKAHTLVVEIKTKNVASQNKLDQKKIQANVDRIAANSAYKEGLENKIAALEGVVTQQQQLVKESVEQVAVAAAEVADLKAQLVKAHAQGAAGVVAVQQKTFVASTASEEASNAAAVAAEEAKLHRLRLGSSNEPTAEEAASQAAAASQAKVASEQALALREAKIKTLESKRNYAQGLLTLAGLVHAGQEAILHRVEAWLNSSVVTLDTFVTAEKLEATQEKESRARKEQQKALEARKVFEESLTQEVVAKMDVESQQQRIQALSYEIEKAIRKKEATASTVSDNEAALAAVRSSEEQSQIAVKDAVEALQKALEAKLPQEQIDALVEKKNTATNTEASLRSSIVQAQGTLADNRKLLEKVAAEEEQLTASKEDAHDAIEESQTAKTEAEAMFSEQAAEIKEEVSIADNALKTSNDTKQAAAVVAKAKKEEAERERVQVKEAMEESIRQANRTAMASMQAERLKAEMLRLQRAATGKAATVLEHERQLEQAKNSLSQVEANEVAARDAQNKAVVTAAGMHAESNKAVIAMMNKAKAATAHEIETTKVREALSAETKALLGEGSAESEELRIEYEKLRREQELKRKQEEALAAAEAAARADPDTSASQKADELGLRAGELSHDRMTDEEAEAAAEAHLAHLLASVKEQHRKAMALAEKAALRRSEEHIARLKADVAQNKLSSSEAIAEELQKELAAEDHSLEQARLYQESKQVALQSAKGQHSLGETQVTQAAQNIKDSFMPAVMRKAGETTDKQVLADVQSLKQALEAQRLAGIAAYEAGVASEFVRRQYDATEASIARMSQARATSMVQQDKLQTLLTGLRQERDEDHASASNVTALVLQHVRKLQRNATEGKLLALEEKAKLQIDAMRQQRQQNKLMIEKVGLKEMERREKETRDEVAQLHSNTVLHRELQEHLKATVSAKASIFEGSKQKLSELMHLAQTKATELAVASDDAAVVSQQNMQNCTEARVSTLGVLKHIKELMVMQLEYDRAGPLLCDAATKATLGESAGLKKKLEATLQSVRSTAAHTAAGGLLARLKSRTTTLQATGPARRLLSDGAVKAAMRLSDFLESEQQRARSTKAQHLEALQAQLAAAQVDVERTQARMVVDRATLDNATLALNKLASDTDHTTGALRSYMGEHKAKPGFAESSSELQISRIHWRTVWNKNLLDSEMGSRGVRSLEAAHSAAQFTAQQATEQVATEQAQLELLEGELHKSLNNQALDDERRAVAEERLSTQEGELGSLRMTAADSQKWAAHLAQDLVATQAKTATVEDAQKAQRQSDAEYKAAMTQVKEEMDAERVLSTHIGDTEAKLDNLKAKVEQLEAGLLEVNEDKAQQEAKLSQALKSEDFAHSEDQRASAKVTALAKKLELPAAHMVREASLTIHPDAKQVEVIDQEVPRSVSVSPVFKQALEAAGLHARRSVESSEAKRMYDKLTKVRASTFVKLETQRAHTAELSDALSTLSGYSGSLKAKVRGLEEKEGIAAGEIATEEQEAVQAGQEELNLDEAVDQESVEQGLVGDELKGARDANKLAQAAHRTVQQNAQIAEHTAASVGNGQGGLIEQDSAKIAQLERGVESSRQRAIDIAARLDAANKASAQATQDAAAAKAKVEAVRLAQGEITAQANKIEVDAKESYHHVQAGIQEASQKVVTLEKLHKESVLAAQQAADAARVTVDVNFTMVGSSEDTLAMVAMREGLKEGLADVAHATADDVLLAGMTPCVESTSPFCTEVSMHVSLKNRDAADAAIVAVEAQAEVQGDKGLMGIIQNRWRAKGKFAPGKIALGAATVHDPSLPIGKQEFDSPDRK